MVPAGFPEKQGLYDPQFEHDNCGMGFLVHLKGKRSHKLVRDGIKALINLDHRGACGCEVNTGDGAGILIQIPDAFLRAKCSELGFELPEAGKYGVGCFFMSRDPAQQEVAKAHFEKLIAEEGQKFLGWRILATDNSMLGATSKAAEPVVAHVFVGWGENIKDADHFERKLFVIRRRFRHSSLNLGMDDHKYFYFPSLSCYTLVYKGMLTTTQVEEYYACDLKDERLVSAFCMYHSRFSTNTFPSWQLAHPFRMLCHNGEINTLRGNVNWMRARESLLQSSLFDPGDLEKLLPLSTLR